MPSKLSTAKSISLSFLFVAGAFWNSTFAGSVNVAMIGKPVYAANVCAGTTRVPIVSFTLTTTKTGSSVLKPVLSAFSFTLGAPAAVGDIVKFQLWTNTANDLATATQLGADITPTPGTLTYSFTALNKILPVRVGAVFFWITMDVAASPVNNNTLSVNAPATGDLTFSVSPNTVSGAGKAGGIQTLKANASISLTSAAGTDAQSGCLNTAITNIVYTIGEAGTGASITAGTLPAGVTGSFNAGWFTISGTPTVAGTFSYTVGTSGSSCINTTASGTITINPETTVSLTSGNNIQTVCINTAISDITYTIGGAGTGAGITGLPAGVTGSFSAGVFTITGTPTDAGTFSYTVTTTGPCTNPSLSGTITVNANAPISLASAAGTDAQTVYTNTAIINIVYTIGGAGTGASIITGALPAGVTGTYSVGNFTISGTPTVAGAFSYTVGTSGSSCINKTASGTITVANVGKLAYLEDADTTPPPPPTTLPISIANYPFPRLNNDIWTTHAFTPERMSKYRVVTSPGTHLDEAALLKAAYPDVVSLRYFCPMAYQGEIWSMPFLGTGPSTDGINVYAGHWLYLAGSTTTNSLTATDTSVDIADLTNFVAGQYIVIYDAPAGSFKNAEHAYVTAVNQSTKTLTLSLRGYYSQPLAHAAGSIIAPHELDDDPEFVNKWSYNQSSLCPRDANGKTLGEVMADWLRDNLNRNTNGTVVNAYDGVLFDVDGWKAPTSDDVNDDLIADGGIVNEENTWNIGLEAFYARLRGYYPTALLSGGSPNTRGFSTLNGTQMEGFPSRKHLEYPPDYTILDELMQKYATHMHHQATGPVYCEDKNKTPTLLYDSTIAADNSTFRLSFGMTLMEDGYYGHGGFDHWFDEYSVNVNQGSPEYGKAVASNPLDESQVRANLGWLGKPLGPRYRIYDSSKFIANKTLLYNGGFEAGLSGWSVSQRRGGNTLDINLDNTTSAEGVSSLHASKMKTYSPLIGGARVYAPLVTLKANVQYTVCFSMKSSGFRQIDLQLSNMDQQFYACTNWMRYVACFTSATAGVFSPAFLLGQQNTEVWIDAVYVFEGNADVFRRDFDNGIIVVNATPDPVSVDLSGTFQRIQGTGQDPINDGSTLTGVTLPAYDAAILLRPDTSQANKSVSISNAITDSVKQEASFILLYPNPATSFLNVTFNASGAKAEIQIVNILGQVMQAKSLIVQKGINAQQMDVSGLSPGMYFLVIKTKSQVFKGKFVKI